MSKKSPNRLTRGWRRNEYTIKWWVGPEQVESVILRHDEEGWELISVIMSKPRKEYPLCAAEYQLFFKRPIKRETNIVEETNESEAEDTN